MGQLGGSRLTFSGILEPGSGGRKGGCFANILAEVDVSARILGRGLCVFVCVVLSGEVAGTTILDSFLSYSL